MSSPQLYLHFIDGSYVDSSAHYEVRYPYTGEPVATVARAGEAEMEAAVASAARAFQTTRRMTRAQRAEILAATSRSVAERSAEFARAITLGTGKPIGYARAEVGRTVGVLALAAEEAKRFGGSYEPLDFDPLHPGAVGIVERRPLGPIAAIAPFNFPLNLVTHKVAPALATGNSIVVKPPPQCPGPALMLAEIAHAAGLPAGALNVISADPPVAERLAIDERFRMLSFTGSAKVGWALKAKCGRQRIALELGGNGGLIVDETADLSEAAARAARGAFIHAGQVCLSVQRIFVQRGVYSKFVDRFVAETGKLAVGDPMKDETIVGPLISADAAARVMDWIGEAKSAGATVLTGDRRDGCVVWPTIVEVTRPEHRRLRVWCEEVFGPVATVEAIESFDEGVRLTNDSPYGLQAGVFTADLNRAFAAFREIDAGAVIVGDTGVFRVDSYPFGGSKGSGLGREGVKWAMEEMTEPRMLVLNLAHRS
jgi:glyceraldehyde-3-phosphate dehydrogenase (NADP+)